MEYNEGKKNTLLIGFILLCDLAISNALYWLLSVDSGARALDSGVLHTMVTGSVVYLICTWQGGEILYRRAVGSFQIVLCVVRNIVFYAVFSYILFRFGSYRTLTLPWMLAYWGLLMVLIAAFRLLARHIIVLYRTRTGNVSKVVFVGHSDSMMKLYEDMNSDMSPGHKVMGYFDDTADEPYEAVGCARLGSVSDVSTWLDAHPKVHEVFCCLSSRREGEIQPIIKYCKRHCLRFVNVPGVSDYCHHPMHPKMFGDVLCLSLYREPLSYTENRVIKRAFDIVFSILFICTLFPVILVVVAIMTWLTMPGPVFFLQRRNGINGKEFTCIKFRSMKVNKEADTLQATKDDPRKTWWGDIMRKTNLDETPQFINVLLGQMSIVGPRPHMVNQNVEYSKLIEDYMVRHVIKPGITGWSQVTGWRGETRELTQMEERVNHDIWYIENWSFTLDLYIIYRTVRAMLLGDKNAY